MEYRIKVSSLREKYFLKETMSKFIDSLHIRTRKMVNYTRAEIKSKETLMEVWMRF